jgi:xylose dehydrogenase (NAD/NADP)
MSDQIAWGILGNATIARCCIIPALHKSRNGVLRALATRTPAAAMALCENNEIGRLYGSYDELLRDPDIDAIYNPLPNHLHHSFTLKALREGKHVLCEKPLACCAREAAEMAETADRKGLLLMESWSYRFHPRTLLIRQMIKDGAIGMPSLIRTAFCFHLDEHHFSSRDMFRLNPEMGGGALLDVGCYGVSLARWLLDLNPLEVQAQSVYHQTGVDIHTVGSIRFPGDVLATFEASFVTALQQTYTVVGSDGVIELPHDAFIPRENEACFTLRGKQEETGARYQVAGTDAYQLMVEHFSDAVMGKIPLAFQPAESVRNMQVLDALALAAKSGKTINLQH